jgi:translocation and assembly module TamB
MRSTGSNPNLKPNSKPNSTTSTKSADGSLATASHLWRTVFTVLFALTLLMVLATVGAIQTQTGARLLWQGLTHAMHGSVDGEFMSGTLADGLTLRNVTYRSAGQVIKIDSLQSKWHLFRSPLSLDITQFKINTLDLTLLPTPPKPIVLPNQIKLPIGLDLKNVQIRHLIVHQNSATSEYSDIALHGSSDGIEHTLTLANAVTPFGIAKGTFNVNGKRPFALTGHAKLIGTEKGSSYAIDSRLSGSLELLGIHLDAQGYQLHGSAVVEATPFAAVPLQSAQLELTHVDPKAINPAWPHADIDLHALLKPVQPLSKAAQPGTTPSAQLQIAGPITITNTLAGPLDQGLLPLKSAAINVNIEPTRQQLTAVKITLPDNATLSGNGVLQKSSTATTGSLQLVANNLNLQAIHSSLLSTSFKGPLTARINGNQQSLELALADSSVSVSAAADITPKQITIKSAQIKAGAAELAIHATLTRDEAAIYAVAGKLVNFNPALFIPGATSTASRHTGKAAGNHSALNVKVARINTTFDAQGSLRPELRANVNFKIYDSAYDNLPMTGNGELHLVGKQLLPSKVDLFIAGNALKLNGSFGQPADLLHIDLNAPALNRLGFGLSGLLKIQGQLGGTMTRPEVDAHYVAEHLSFGKYRADYLSGNAKTQGVPGTTPDAKITFGLKGRGLSTGDIQLANIKAAIDGVYASHTIELSTNGKVRGQPLAASVKAQGNLKEVSGGMTWDGTIKSLENTAVPRVHLTAPMHVVLAPGKLELGAGRLSVAHTVIDLKSFRYQPGSLVSEGRISALSIAEILKLREQFTGITTPLDTNLVFDANWNVRLANRASGNFQINRRSGDVRVSNNALALTAFALRADLAGTAVKLNANVAATRLGPINAQGRIGLLPIDGMVMVTPDSSVAGHVTAAIAQLKSLGVLAGPGIALVGRANADIVVSGVLGNPKLSGTVNGDGLGVTLYDQGIRLHDGIARITLNNNIVELRQLQLHGGDGTLRATGRIALDQSNQGLNATVIADKLQLLSHPSGKLTLSGQAKASNVDGRLLIAGKFTVDQAQFSLPEKSAPKLGDDVVIIRGGKAPPTVARNSSDGAVKPAGAFTPAVDVDVNLGKQFYFKGSGAELRLIGALKVQSAPGESPEAFGTIRVAEGSYEAFGTKLAIENGVINFQGPLRNPNINILAMRRQADIASGVKISGTAQRPRVTLVSEPEMAQEEKLSWLVFGHGSSSGSGAGGTGQAQTAVKGAALGLLNNLGGKNVAKTFGLDQLALGSSEYGLNGGQVVNLGKKISDKISIGYEQSLASAGSVLKLTYDLSQYWSLVLRGGTVTGMDVLYNKRFDTLRKKQ